MLAPNSLGRFAALILLRKRKHPQAFGSKKEPSLGERQLPQPTFGISVPAPSMVESSSEKQVFHWGSTHYVLFERDPHAICD
jgi:hypothetical protein